MEAADLHRLSTTALFAIADAAHSGITPPLVATAMERELRLPTERFQVAPSTFPRADFLVTFHRRSDRDAALEEHSFPVRGVLFRLRPWLPPAGTGTRHVRRRFYCRLALDNLPLRAWEWGVVAEMLGVDCDLDRIERQSLTRRNTEGLFAWVWTSSPDNVPLSAELSLLDRPCARRGTPEGAPAADQAGEEGSVTTVLIHLDETQDYTPPRPC